MESYEQKKQRLIAQITSAGDRASIGLAKRTTNLFRERSGIAKKRLDVRDFQSVLSINTDEQWVEVEGMTPYSRLVDALLPYGFIPAVTPQLKSITIGGAVSGVGIESTSFHSGLVHETILEMDVLLPDGRVLLCTPRNEHRDLFFGLANSYGTLGYILKLKARILPIRPYVQVTHHRFSTPAEFFTALQAACASHVDFVDGVVFSGTDFVLSTGRFVETAPFVSDYTWRKIYYRSLREKKVDYLTTRDYLWRWDTDWFWCSKHLGCENGLVRFLVGRRFLNSVTYMTLMKFGSRWRLNERFHRWRGIHSEAVIQDILIPIDRSEKFLTFLLAEIGMTPIWICPTRSPVPQEYFPFFPLSADTLMMDFGFWGVRYDKTAHPLGFANRKIERMTSELGGIKSLYSEAFYPQEEFWTIYNKPAYDRLKSVYDPHAQLKDLYAKCVLRY